jgi:16S rRNA A1518/A1519 N6-dimethyltransferase RsmA/KsgA/DIM1 with predicted DNA glycosylase/AP lyase activity
VGSALLRLRRTAPAASEGLAALVRLAFAHRRKSLPRSLELSRAGSLEPARRALEAMGKPTDTRAEALSPFEFAELAEQLAKAAP